MWLGALIAPSGTAEFARSANDKCRVDVEGDILMSIFCVCFGFWAIAAVDCLMTVNCWPVSSSALAFGGRIANNSTFATVK